MYMSEDEVVDFVAGLHDVAAFLARNPEVCDRVSPVRFYVAVYDYEDAPAKQKMQEYARLLAPCEKHYEGRDFELRKSFGPHTLTVYTNRENVCTKRIVGTKQVERTTYTVEQQQIRDAMPTVTVYEDEDIVEWECPPSLLGD
jgi:hypothetical protein